MDSQPTIVTELLAKIQTGDRDAESRLYELLYKDLRAIAYRFLQNERAGHTLQPTALVNEAYVRLFGHLKAPIRDRQHFLALAATAMRRILVDHARAKGAGKRGKRDTSVPIENVVAYDPAEPEQLVFIDELLTRLAAWDERQCRILELRYFGGLTESEMAEVLGLSERQIRRDFKMGQAWLAGELRGGGVSVGN